MIFVHPGINVNQARTNYGDTPHYVASQEGHVEVVKALLAQPNINVNQARTDLEWKGISLLWIASFNRYAEGCIISPGLIDIDAWVHKKNLHHFQQEEPAPLPKILLWMQYKGQFSHL